MRRLMVTVLVTGALLVLLPGAAVAKGPSEAVISGPGLAAPLRIGGTSEMVQPGQLSEAARGDDSRQFGALMQHAGFSEGVWGLQPEAPGMDEPVGELGPRFTVTWTLPGPSGAEDTVSQDLYPYAEVGPVTHVAPWQPFFDGQRTPGGWFAGGPALSALLLDLGLREPVPPPGRRPASPVLVALGGVIVATGWALAWTVRRRRRPVVLPG